MKHPTSWGTQIPICPPPNLLTCVQSARVPPFTHVPPQGPTTRPGQSHCTGDRRLPAPFGCARLQHTYRGAHSPIGKRLGPAPPTPTPPRAGRVTLRAPPRWRSGHTHGPLGSLWVPSSPREIPSVGFSPRCRPCLIPVHPAHPAARVPQEPMALETAGGAGGAAARYLRRRWRVPSPAEYRRGAPAHSERRWRGRGRSARLRSLSEP